MDRSYYLKLSLPAGALILLRAFGEDLPDWAWGLNYMGRLPGLSIIIWTAAGLIALSPLVFDRWAAPRWPAQARPSAAWKAGLFFLVVAFIFPKISTPLLGDGIDRLEATLAGLSELVKGQPAPLDLTVHYGAYRILVWINPEADSWMISWLSWRLMSLVAGGLASACLWKLALRKADNRGERWFIFITIMASGSLIFFFGYVENYVFLAAAIFAYLLIFDLTAKREAPVYVLLSANLVLIGLHYFMILLLPATIYALHRHRRWRPSLAATVVILIFVLGFGGFMFAMVREHYRGVAAIFVAPGKLFSAYHLIGFINQQLLACPALPLLLVVALLSRDAEPDALISFTGAASLLLLIFFFLLRPKLGPSADWDLFTMPALLFTPWLVLKIRAGFGKRPQRAAAAGWTLIVLSLATSGPWLSLNCREVHSIALFKGFLQWEAKYNPWAASTGYLRLGRYLSRRKWERNNPEIKGSLLMAVELSPSSATFRRQAASMLEAIGEEELAKAQFIESHRLMAEHHLEKKQYLEAAREYQQALKLDPGSVSILRSLAELFEGPLAEPKQAEFYRTQLKLKAP